MDQEVLKTSLSGLERKVLVLLNEHRSLKEELRSVKQENLALRDNLRMRDEQLSNFKNQVKITKIVNQINPEEGGNSELKRKVEEYIREIDKCIAYLSK